MPSSPSSRSLRRARPACHRLAVSRRSKASCAPRRRMGWSRSTACTTKRRGASLPRIRCGGRSVLAKFPGVWERHSSFGFAALRSTDDSAGWATGPLRCGRSSCMSKGGVSRTPTRSRSSSVAETIPSRRSARPESSEARSCPPCRRGSPPEPTSRCMFTIGVRPSARSASSRWKTSPRPVSRTGTSCEPTSTGWNWSCHGIATPLKPFEERRWRRGRIPAVGRLDSRRAAIAEVRDLLTRCRAERRKRWRLVGGPTGRPRFGWAGGISRCWIVRSRRRSGRFARSIERSRDRPKGGAPRLGASTRRSVPSRHFGNESRTCEDVAPSAREGRRLDPVERLGRSVRGVVRTGERLGAVGRRRRSGASVARPCGQPVPAYDDRLAPAVRNSADDSEARVHSTVSASGLLGRSRDDSRSLTDELDDSRSAGFVRKTRQARESGGLRKASGRPSIGQIELSERSGSSIVEVREIAPRAARGDVPSASHGRFGSGCAPLGDHDSSG